MRITGFGSSSALATGTTASGGIDMRIGSVAGKARTVLGNSNSCRETALRSFTVHDVMDEFSRISRVVAMQIFSEEYVISSLLSLVRAGIIVLNNGHDDDIPRDLVTMRTVVNFLPAEHEFAAAFRKGYIAEGTSSSSSITQNRSAGIVLRVSNRVRRAVLHPQEQILIDGIR